MPPRFFLPGAVLSGTLSLSSEDSHHIHRVLRLRPGDHVTICNAANLDAACILDDSGNPVVQSVAPNIAEPPIALHLYPSLHKSDRFEWLLQKAVELGTASITPVMSTRCNVKIPEQNKVLRWQRILRQAAEQSGRGIIPQLHPVTSLSAALAVSPGHPIFCYEEEQEYKLSQAFSHICESASIFTGPEGGYDPEEVETVCSQGIQPVSLGLRILRCETAPLYVLSALLHHFS